MPTTSNDHKTNQITDGTMGTHGVTGAAAGSMFTDSHLIAYHFEF